MQVPAAQGSADLAMHESTENVRCGADTYDADMYLSCFTPYVYLVCSAMQNLFCAVLRHLPQLSAQLCHGFVEALVA